MIVGAATEQGPVRRSLLRRAPRALARTLVGLTIGALVLAVAPAALAGLLQPSSATLAAGHAPVLPCGDVSAAVLTYDVTAGRVARVTVSGLPATCNGAGLWLTLTTNGDPAAIAGPVTVAGGQAVVPIPNGPTSTTVTDARIALLG